LELLFCGLSLPFSSKAYESKVQNHSSVDESNTHLSLVNCSLAKVVVKAINVENPQSRDTVLQTLANLASHNMSMLRLLSEEVRKCVDLVSFVHELAGTLDFNYVQRVINVLSNVQLALLS
jgi:hypothetical protein